MAVSEIEAVRAASRQLVRELKVLNGDGCIPGLSFSECHVLTELDQRGRLTAADLCEALVLEKSTVSRLVAGLKKKALIDVQANPGDRRQRPLVVTASGRETLKRLHAAADREVGEALQFLTTAERAAVARAMDRYARALRHARRSAAYRIRPIESEDDAQVARVITEVMTEFGAVGHGYSIEDPEVQAMHAHYQHPRSILNVVISRTSGEVLGCGGVAPLVDGDPDTCELRKMYFMPGLRGSGMGTRLLITCLNQARSFGFKRCYLETLQSMHQARRLYRKLGFEDLDAPMGATGHHGCNRWMAMALVDDRQ